MSQRKIDKRTKTKKPPALQLRVDPKLAKARWLRREGEEISVYIDIYQGKFDLEKRHDWEYLREKAGQYKLSIGKLQKVLDRIWADAKRDYNKAGGKNAAGRNEGQPDHEATAGEPKDVCDSSGN